MRRTDVLERCRLAAEAIMQLPPQEWAGWICWLMEAMDEPRDEDRRLAEDVLADIERDLKQRLETGRW